MLPVTGRLRQTKISHMILVFCLLANRINFHKKSTSVKRRRKSIKSEMGHCCMTEDELCLEA